jgi:hypothetical protein
MVEAAKRGDELPQINTVQMATGELISMDNRRVYAGRQAAKEKKGYRLKGIVWKYDQLLPNGKLRSNFTLREGEVEKLQKMGKRIGKNPPSTWGEAVHLRILRQEIFEGGEGFSEKYPNGSPFDPKVVGRPDSH